MYYSWSLFWFLLITEGAPSRLQWNSSSALGNRLFGIPTIFEKNFKYSQKQAKFDIFLFVCGSQSDIQFERKKPPVAKWMTAKRPGSHDMKRLKNWRLLMGAISFCKVLLLLLHTTIYLDHHFIVISIRLSFLPDIVVWEHLIKDTNRKIRTTFCVESKYGSNKVTY